MALPTVWELLLPNFTITTIIGILLIAIGVFKGPILLFLGKVLSFFSGGEIKQGALVTTFIGGGIVMVWLPSIMQDLFSSVEGTIVFIAVVVFLLLILILFGRKGKGKTIQGF